MGNSMKAFAKKLLVATPWIVLICLGVCHLWNHTFSFPWIWQENGRVVAPSGTCELVTYKGNRGAMSSSAYVCFLGRPGEKVDPNACDLYEPVLSTSHTVPKPRWDNNDRLIINCDGGYVTHQRPYSRVFKVGIIVEGAENPPRLARQ